MDISTNTTIVGGTHSNTPIYVTGTGIQLQLGGGWTKGMFAYIIPADGSTFDVVGGAATLIVPGGTSASSATSLAGIVALECYADGKLRAASQAGAGNVSAPAAPTGLTLGTATGSAQPLTWTAPTDNGGSAITGYRVGVRTPVGSGAYAYTNTGSAEASTTITGLTASTAYEYVVDAVNAVGSGADSASASGSTAAAALAKTTVVGCEWTVLPAISTQAGPYDTVVFRQADTIGSGAITHIGMGFGNFVFATNAGAFSAAPAFTFSQCFVNVTAPNGTTYTAPLTWDGGAATKAVAAGATVGSDVVSIATLTGGVYTSFPVGTVPFYDAVQAYPVGGGVSSVANGVTSPFAGRTTCSARIYSSASGAAPTGLGSGGAIGVSGSSAAWHIPRVFAIGKFASAASIAVVEFGDSIPNGVGDPGNPADAWIGGYAHRGRHVGAYGTGKIAGLRLTASGSTALALNTNGALAYALLPFANVLASETGRNTTGDETGERAAEVALLNAAYDAGIRAFVRVALFPVSSSTDAWATTANQTPTTAYSDTREAWQKTIYTAGAATRGKYNYWCDMPSVRAGTTTPDRWKWAANGTANAFAWDSIHPSSGGAGAGGGDYRTTLLTVAP